ncbi:patatin-domain-containing protein [Melanomma pulvis-pyrius CBS 109.77]|uniref:Patatin-domain-containing protein n=1 Tax=Melanomma pulvis-pyrius CBS 109.77 TaxID=1314802 RepID=A0A6A6WRG1_9PLEO|nr:patatin-domain-containing protein [Melanomma pulvis-pyrius CBS 109.77]
MSPPRVLRPTCRRTRSRWRWSGGRVAGSVVAGSGAGAGGVEGRECALGGGVRARHGVSSTTDDAPHCPMADVKKDTDGPAPDTASAFDLTQLPDYNNDFITEDDLDEFAKALAAPETSPSAEDLTAPLQERRTFITALNDWRPIHQKVRRRRKHSKKPPRRGKDETREGFVYVLLKWPLLIVVFGWLIFLGISYVFTRLYIYLYEHWVTWRGRRQRLRKQLQNATSYEDWVQGSKELDTYLGNDEWKSADEYAYYDSKTIRRVHGQMVKLRQRAESDENGKSGGNAGDQHKAVEDLRGLLEACVKNNFVGFENPRLYSETYYGTKDLVQSFVDEVEASLACLLHTTQLDQESKRAMFKHLSTNFGRTALCLSGGATFAYYHFGVAKALLDAGLLPEVITGTSGGALVAGLLGTRTDDELKKLLVPALAHRITACADDIFTWSKRWYRTGARFDSVDWAKRCSWFTRGSMTFREAYHRTGRILNVSCVPSDPHSPTILANYLTAPDCVIWSAVLASAAVPGILNPVVLMKKMKDGTLAPYSFGHKWKDGSLRTDIPLKALNLHFNVRFSIVSQVNPHINIFFFSSRGSVGRPVTHRRGRGWRGGFIGSAIEQYLKLDLTKWLKVLRHLELLPRPMGQDWSEIWLQRFSGTITIWPKSIPSDFYHILSDPTPHRLARMIHVGQQSAFPKLKFIANRAKLERLIQQGRRQYRPRGLRDGGLADILSEDDLQGLLKRSTGDNPDKYPLSGSESSSSAGVSRPGSPVDMPLGFSFTKQKKHAPAHLKTATSGPTKKAPDSPSIGKRLSGWWSALSPPAGSSTSTARPRPRVQRNPTTSPPLASPYIDRPSSMFELHPPRDIRNLYSQPQNAEASGHRKPGSFLKEIRRQSRVFVDDESDEVEDRDADFEGVGRSGDAGPGAQDDVESFGDDEDDGEAEAQIKSEAFGLGLHRGGEGVIE